MKTTDSSLWKTLKFLQVNKLYRQVKYALPPSVINVVNDLALRHSYAPLVDAQQLEPKYEIAWKYLQRLGLGLGDYLEFGVSIGTSMACMHRVLTKLGLNNIKLFGFDSFQGLPDSAATEDGGTWKPGEFASTLSETKTFLTKSGVNWNRTHLIQGWFENTLNATTTAQYGIRKASVIMIDCDIYSASKIALTYSLPLIVDYSVIFFDDWKDDKTFGEYKAYSEFLSEHKHIQSEELGKYFPTGKIFVAKNTNAVAG